MTLGMGRPMARRKPSETPVTNRVVFINQPLDRFDNSPYGIIEILRSVDHTDEKAKLNETSISDNNGGRIML